MDRYIDPVESQSNKLICHDILNNYPSEYHYLIHWFCKHDSEYNKLRETDLNDISIKIIENYNMNPGMSSDKIKQLMIDSYINYQSVCFHVNHGTNDCYYYHWKNNVILWIKVQYKADLFDSYARLFLLVNDKINLLPEDLGINYIKYTKENIVQWSLQELFLVKICNKIKNRKDRNDSGFVV